MIADSAQVSVLKRYPRAVAHMWRQVNGGRFGLVVGAGVNTPLGIPNWQDLVLRIAGHPKVQADGLKREFGTTPTPILTQILLHHYYQRCLETEVGLESRNARDRWRLVSAQFRDIMHECLYKDVPEDDEDLLAKDDFFKHYLDVVRRSPLTVVYNFDDTLERLLLMTRSKEERDKGSRGFEVVTEGRQQFRRRESVIYHPNGYLPRRLIEGRSDNMIFTEDTMEDQLISAVAGEYSTLLHHLSKNTCLLVGLSLDDSVLRHILRQSARISPGQYHYYVSYVDDVPAVMTDQQKAREAANFDVFNLITLYLDRAGIEALGTLLAKPKEQLRQLADEQDVNLTHTFYLTGVPGVGKTTTFNYFKNLTTFDEWGSERLPEMGKPWIELTKDEQDRVDRFVLEQWYLKNLALLEDTREIGIGIALVDRCLPDALAFTPHDGWPAKATSLLAAISPGHSRRAVHPGHVILLKGAPPELVVRARCSGKTSEEEYVRSLQRDTEITYGVGNKSLEGVTVLEVVPDAVEFEGGPHLHPIW